MSKCMEMDLSPAGETDKCKNSADVYFLHHFCLKRCQYPMYLASSARQLGKQKFYLDLRVNLFS